MVYNPYRDPFKINCTGIVTGLNKRRLKDFPLIRSYIWDSDWQGGKMIWNFREKGLLIASKISGGSNLSYFFDWVFVDAQVLYDICELL